MALALLAAASGPAPAQIVNRDLTLQASKKKVPKGKKVKLTGVLTLAPRQGDCLANQEIELAKRKPSAEDFETFTTVQTNAQGQFKKKVKVKKTTVYFARAPSNGDCFLATADSVTVKAKKKRK